MYFCGKLEVNKNELLAIKKSILRLGVFQYQSGLCVATGF